MTLDVHGIEKRFEDFRLGPISLSVDDVTAVLGPSGCGKTTLLSIVAGLVPADAGGVWLDGRNLDGVPPEDRGTAMVFQDGALFPHMTARENVEYAATNSRHVDDLAASMELEGVLDRPATELSGGEVQRVVLARALAADPDALLLDEPLVNLDAPIRRRLRRELRAHLAALNVPVLYVTHDQRGAAAIGDRVAVMADGELHQVGKPRSVFERPATSFVASFTGGANRFHAIVADSTDRLVLDWNGRRLTAFGPAADPGTAVEWFVRPEYLQLGAEATKNAFAARIENVSFEGDAVVISLLAGEQPLEARLPPVAFDRLGIETGEEVQVGVPPDAIHVLD